MGFLLRRRKRQSDSGSYQYELAALHLQLLVAMAAADHELRSSEVDELAKFIDRSMLEVDDTYRLDQLLRILVEAPPEFERLIGDLAPLRENTKLAIALVDDLERVAHSDSRIDYREEQLLRLVCAALEVAPRALHDGRPAKLRDSERELLQSLVHGVVSS